MNHPPPAAAPPPPPLSLPLQPSPTKSTNSPLPALASTLPPQPKTVPTSAANTSPTATCVHIPLPSPVKISAAKSISNKNVSVSPTVMSKTCESCAKGHDGSYGSGRFCSSNCAKKVGANIKWRQVVGNNCISRGGSGVAGGGHGGKNTGNIGNSGAASTGCGTGNGGSSARKRRKQEERKCENCCTSHDGSYGSGRFCSVHCARRVAASRKWEKQRGEKRRLAGLIKRRRMTPSPPPPAPITSTAGDCASLKRSVSAPAGGTMSRNDVGIGGYVDYSTPAVHSPCTPMQQAHAAVASQHGEHHTSVTVQPVQPRYWAVSPPQYAYPAPVGSLVSSPSPTSTPSSPPLYYLVPASPAVAPVTQHHAAGQVHPQYYPGHHPSHFQPVHGMRYPVPTHVDMQNFSMFGVSHGVVPIASEQTRYSRSSDLLAKGTTESVPMASGIAGQSPSERARQEQDQKKQVGGSEKVRSVGSAEMKEKAERDEGVSDSSLDGKDSVTKDSSSAAHVLLSLKARELPVTTTVV